MTSMSTSAVSPLTELLHSTKPLRDRLLSNRDYEAVKDLRETCYTRAEEQKAALHADVRARHATERRRLTRARDAALSEVHDTVQRELQAIEQQWQDRREGFDARQHQRYEQLERTVRMREEGKPVVLSSYVRDLQQSETRLASLHEYDESAQVRRKIGHLEVQERGAAQQAKEVRVQRALDTKRRAMDQDDSNFRAKVKNELQLALSRAQREEDRVRSKFDHIERDMRHAHNLELRKNPLQAPYERPAFIQQRQSKSAGGIVAPTLANTSASAAARGTEYLRRTQGSKLEVESLCDRYRDGVMEELRRTGETLRLGSDPTAPQRLDSRGLIDLSLPPLGATIGHHQAATRGNADASSWSPNRSTASAYAPALSAKSASASAR